MKLEACGWCVVAALLSACPPAPGDPALDASTPGNSCETALPFELPTDGGTVTLLGDATGLFRDHANCMYTRSTTGAGFGPDVIHRFTTTAPVVLEAAIDGGTLHLGINQCKPDCADYSILPKRIGSPFNQQRLRVEVPAGEHTLFAEAFGPYALELRARPVEHGETPDVPIVVDRGAQTFRLDAVKYFDEQWPAAPLGCSFPKCSATISFALNTTERLGLRTVLSSPTPGLSLSTVFGDSLDLSLPKTGRIIEPGTFRFAVSATENTPQQLASYPLDVVVDAQPLAQGDDCEAAIPLELVDAGTSTFSASVSGDTARAYPSHTSQRCGSWPTTDLFFALTLDRTSDLRAEVTTSSMAYRPALGLRAGACTTVEATCTEAVVPGAGAIVVATALPPGPYVLSVYSPDETSGPFDLKVDVTSR